MKIKNYFCPKCGYNHFIIRPNGIHTGIYCGFCGFFIKWANKDEKNIIKASTENIDKTTHNML